MTRWIVYAFGCNFGLYFITLPAARSCPKFATLAYLPAFLASAFIPPKWYNAFFLNFFLAMSIYIYFFPWRRPRMKFPWKVRDDARDEIYQAYHE